ncbi:hypothetical protein F2P81_024504 [Scophthalmus maximus]|uniref:peptide-methionine (S)-S-oxide reductase n=1 Tax=Scophthalmus maximus TaxID=52904 RepID=A0A6A4RZX2_SCOMX|nr:hypothetical protein F2P81_024504 [Scophthalmus maximus]
MNLSVFLPQVLTEEGFGPITTEIAEGKTFYYAEDYHQQYLNKNPDGAPPWICAVLDHLHHAGLQDRGRTDRTDRGFESQSFLYFRNGANG